MFEFEQSIVTRLLTEDEQFSRLYRKHHELKEQVDEAHARALALDEMELENLKKQKLLLKDKMAAMIAEYRRAHA